MKLKKIFGEINMTWLKVILFAIITGVITGIIMLIPAFKGTSIQNIGISYECWILFAVIIVTNCEKKWEAMLKCFVFFLISQPLVYAVEVLAGSYDISQALGFYRFWFIITLLTLPGGFIAYYSKQQNALGSIILGIGNAMELVLCVSYALKTIDEFPKELLSGILCLVFIAIMTIGVQRQTKYRIISGIVVPVLLVAILAVLLKITGKTF